MKTSTASLIAAAIALAPLAAHCGEGRALAEKHRCMACHQVDAKSVGPAFREVAKRFYDAIERNPGAMSVLTGPDQIKRLHATLTDWMSTGLIGPLDERFYEKRSRIGRRHVQIGLAPQYMFTAMNIVRTAYHDFVFAELAPAEAQAAMRSVQKLLDIELAIMLHHYQLDSDDAVHAHVGKDRTGTLACSATARTWASCMAAMATAATTKPACAATSTSAKAA